MSSELEGRAAGSVAGGPSAFREQECSVEIDFDAEFEQWLQRLVATHDAVTYTCTYRVGDPVLAGEVSYRVMAALVGKPQVFRHYGLPYSGRIGRLAEPLIARARQGELVAGTTNQWEELLGQLRVMPTEIRAIVVAGWVLGNRGEALGILLGCDGGTADLRRESALKWMNARVPAEGH